MQVHKIAIKMLLRVDEFKDESDELKIYPQQIKLLNLMKIILDAQWIINRQIFSEMLVITGYMELIDKFKKLEKLIYKSKSRLVIDSD